MLLTRQCHLLYPMYVGKYIVNVWKIFLDSPSRFDDTVSNVTVCTYR